MMANLNKKYVFILLIVGITFLSGKNIEYENKSIDSNSRSYILSGRFLQNGQYAIYNTTPGVIVGNGLLNRGLTSGVPNVNPRGRIASDQAPRLVYSGNFNISSNITFRMGSAAPGTLGETTHRVASGSQNGFSVVINAAQPWAFGAQTQKFDMFTVVIHELCHGIGLAHVDQSFGRLMSESLETNSSIPIGSDELAAFKQIYVNLDTGDMKFYIEDINTTLSKDSNQKLKWHLENIGISDGFILGFNIYKRNKKGELYSVNKRMISSEMDKTDYSFVVDDYNSKDQYYIELIADDSKLNRFIKF